MNKSGKTRAASQSKKQMGGDNASESPSKPQKSPIKSEDLQQKEFNLECYKFTHFQPQGIECLCLSKDKQLVALSRSDCSIEVWLRSSWTQLIKIAGNLNAPIRNLHWLENTKPGSSSTYQPENNNNNVLYFNDKKRRLISTGLNGVVIEWDLLEQNIRFKHSIQSPIWQAVQVPAANSKVGKYFLLACEDGGIKMVKARKRSIEMTRATVRVAEARCLSIAVEQKSQGMKQTEDDNTPNVNVWAGYSDGTIRKWDLTSGECLMHIQTQEKKRQIGESDTLIWSLSLVKTKSGEQFLFSGNNFGVLSVWDPIQGTLVKQFKQLEADISCIEFNKQFSAVYATGVDSRILTVQFNDNSFQSNQEESQKQALVASSQWVFCNLFRGQSHDIKSLKLTSDFELISGGETTDICIYQLNAQGTLNDQFGQGQKTTKSSQLVRHVPPFPFQSPVQMAGSLLMMNNGQSLDLYSTMSAKKMLKIQKKGDFQIQQAALVEISQEAGQYLIVYSDAQDTQIYVFDTKGFKLSKLTKQVCYKAEVKALPSVLRIFQAKDKVYLLTTELVLLALDLATLTLDKEIHNIKRLLVKHFDDQKLRRYDQIVSQACELNKNSNLLTLTFMNPIFNCIIRLPSENSDLKAPEVFWALPNLSKTFGFPLCIASDMDKIIFVHDSNKICVLDIVNRRLHPWSKQNSDNFPQNWLNRYNRLVGIKQVTNQKFFVWSHYTYAVLDLSLPLPEKEVLIVQDHPRKTFQGKHAEGETHWADMVKLVQQKYLSQQTNQILQNQSQSQSTLQSHDNLTISNKLKGILAVEYDEQSTRITVVQNKWKQVLQNFQGAFIAKKFKQ